MTDGAEGDSGGSDGPRPTRIQSVDRAILLLKVVAGAEERPTAAELAVACGLNRTTAWRLLTTLEEHGLVERDGAQRYGVGYAAVALANSRSGSGALARAARPVLEWLAEEAGTTVSLSVGDSRGVVALDQIDPVGATLVLNYRGKRLPLHAASNGKVLLASFSDAEVDALLQEPLEPLTDATVVDPERVRALVDAVRRDGYATTVGEIDPGVNGVSVPVTDRAGAVQAMLSLSDTEHRLPAERLEELVPVLREGAERLGRELA
jgi:DNA-binding IclR family transcriptional regulator